MGQVPVTTTRGSTPSRRITPPPPGHVPVSRVLVELAELPVDGEDVHVVVLLEIVSQQVQRVGAGLQPLLVLVDLLHLRDGGHRRRAAERRPSCWARWL